MSEYDDEREVARRYRELPREEPRPALDAAIRAAARGGSRRGARTWYLPVAAAALLILAVAVTWQVERNKPEFIVATGPTESKLRKEQPAAVPQSVPEPKEAKPEPKEAKPQQRELARSTTQPAPAAAEAASGELAAPQDSVAKRSSRTAGVRADAAAPRPLESLGLDEAPAPWLKRIAELRRQGKHDEADHALAEFRKRYPAYAIPPEMLGKVERK
jgi:Meckel syndrome type 1 protein